MKSRPLGFLYFTLSDQEPLIIDITNNWLIDGKRARRPCCHSSVIARPVGKNMLIDAHAHLDHYGDELESVLMEITQHEIFTISNSMDPSSYRRNLEIAEKCRLVLPTFGIHPRRAPE